MRCKRCDGWRGVFFRLLREIFREKLRFAVRAFARGQRVDWGKTKMRARGAVRSENRAPRPLIRERLLASLMTRRRVLA